MKKINLRKRFLLLARDSKVFNKVATTVTSQLKTIKSSNLRLLLLFGKVTNLTFQKTSAKQKIHFIFKKL